MRKVKMLGAATACLVAAASTVGIAGGHDRKLVVTMTNDPRSNQIRLYDADTGALLQTVSTHGMGGVGGNTRGIRQHEGRLVAASARAR